MEAREIGTSVVQLQNRANDDLCLVSNDKGLAVVKIVALECKDLSFDLDLQSLCVIVVDSYDVL